MQNLSSIDMQSGAALPFIAADVGGTHARVGWVRARGLHGLDVELLEVERYACADWPSLGDILADFGARLPVDRAGATARPATYAVLACAGFLQDDAIANVNLPWPLAIEPTRVRAGLSRVEFINDFEALAHAIPSLDAGALRTVVGGTTPFGLANGPVAVMGPGTGLGCAAVLPGTVRDPRARILPSEGSHVLLATGTPREAAILARMAQTGADIDVDYVLSGRGLLRLYRAISELDGLPQVLATPAEVSRAGMAGESVAAREALEVFCALLGSFCADVAIMLRATGGVVLAGGVLPHIESFLASSDFAQRFQRAGVMRSFLERVPVRLIDHGDLGIIGAGCWSLGQRG
jgi:glucokinase